MNSTPFLQFTSQLVVVVVEAAMAIMMMITMGQQGRTDPRRGSGGSKEQGGIMQKVQETKKGDNGSLSMVLKCKGSRATPVIVFQAFWPTLLVPCQLFCHYLVTLFCLFDSRWTLGLMFGSYFWESRACPQSMIYVVNLGIINISFCHCPKKKSTIQVSLCG